MVGYWSNHEYKRRSVTKDSELGFLGFDWIKKQLDKYNGKPKAQRNRALFLTYFKTAGRACESLQLKRSNFTHDENYIIIKDMVKEKDKDSKTYQLIKIPKLEPLNKEWINWINQCKKDSYVFPSPTKKDQPLSYIRIYQIITKTGTYPHFLRSQRSSMEIAFYKIHPNLIQDLRQWKTSEMVQVYASAETRRTAQEKMLEKYT